MSNRLNGVLTVIIRDDSPVIHCNDVPSYRTVRIELTTEQIDRIELFQVEKISRVILE